MTRQFNALLINDLLMDVMDSVCDALKHSTRPPCIIWNNCKSEVMRRGDQSGNNYLTHIKTTTVTPEWRVLNARPPSITGDNGAKHEL